ncbi:maleylpyruvate isomerase family mycothiol-dependent enzyme [Allorhizocola rhizosphaerae]|uniref:maleylpyruvate isomerase family mycothiol-dependent enzyme n=1 Tax=Allorhizocola rhizosphaerae TaxID=1872709 RepID=UPI0013C31E4A|nr:maleylpyruvate isomerase family mycothiol-dependent enzyme [Allorhizocola rhizosphaerae]
MDYLTHLAADYQRLASVCAGRLSARVPTCPEWTVDDLVGHVARVYLHKVECMRQGKLPRPWPPDLSGEPTMAVLDRAYRELVAEFAARPAESPAYTFYEPDQTVGFWMRRMAHETVIHRIDGELAAGVDCLPIADELALDGIDEVLQVFLAWASRAWPEDFTEPLSAGPGSVAILALPAAFPSSSTTAPAGPPPPGAAQLPRHAAAPPASAASPSPGAAMAPHSLVASVASPCRWLVSWDAKTIDLAVTDAPARAQISGTPEAVVRWLWRRSESGVTIHGEGAQVAQMRQLLTAATQ